MLLLEAPLVPLWSNFIALCFWMWAISALPKARGSQARSLFHREAGRASCSDPVTAPHAESCHKDILVIQA